MLACVSVSTLAAGDITNIGGAVVLAEPPASITHMTNPWESNAEIRVWCERSFALVSSLTVGHTPSGPVVSGPVVNGSVPAGTPIETYMVRADPVASGPIDLQGFVTFDREILGVYIGSQLTPLDGALGRPGISYNQNNFRGLELDGPGGPSNDSFEISMDRFRLDFRLHVGDWTDDIRVVVRGSTPIAVAGGACVIAEPPSSIFVGQWESNSEVRTWFERSFVVAAPLTMGHVSPGLIDDVNDLVSGDIPVGTRVCSHMIRLDPVGIGPITLAGMVRFDAPVLGVWIGSQLNPTDSLCKRPGVSYNTNSARGLECDGPGGASADEFEISADRRRIEFTMAAGSETDDIRVLVALPDQFVRGDANRDASINLVDAVHTLTYLFASGPATCEDALDTNDDGTINLVDVVFLLAHLFNGGPAPISPYPESGYDTSPDALNCLD